MTLQNYEILNKDILTAVWNDNELEIVNETLLPQYLKKVHNADMWLETRAIDSHRTHSRLLKKALRLKERDDVSTVIAVNAVTITDNYWIRPIGSKLKYADVDFDKSTYTMGKSAAKLALSGSSTSFNVVASRNSRPTPELTNTGSFEKCWKYEDGSWWMYKAANRFERFSEMFVYLLGLRLGFNMAQYCYANKGGFIKSLDFTHGGRVNFEPAFTFMGDNENYIDTVKELERLCPQSVNDYVNMLFLDTVTMNPDRHTANFGLLRNADTGEYIGLAPLFDHNMALIARGYPSNTKVGKNDMLINDFEELAKDRGGYAIPEISRDMIVEIIESVNKSFKTNVIADMVMNRYEEIKRRLGVKV